MFMNDKIRIILENFENEYKEIILNPRKIKVKIIKQDTRGIDVVFPEYEVQENLREADDLVSLLNKIGPKIWSNWVKLLLRINKDETISVYFYDVKIAKIVPDVKLYHGTPEEVFVRLDKLFKELNKILKNLPEVYEGYIELE